MRRYDLIILGHGAAAFAAAIKANELGVKTAMVGTNVTAGTLTGGTCVNVGCLPSKHLITVSNLFYHAANNSFEGIKYDNGRLDFKKVMEQKDKLVEKFRNEKYVNVLKDLENVTYYNKIAKFISKNEIDADTEKIDGEKFFIGTGAKSDIVPIKGIENVDYLTNEEVLSLKDLPGSMIVVGGRALGLEFAQMYAHFGTKVTVLQRSDRIIPESEPEISDALKIYLEEEGIKIYTGASINGVSKKGKNKIVNVNVGNKNFEIEAEQLLLATGRKPNTENLGLDKVGVKTDEKGFIIVNNDLL